MKIEHSAAVELALGKAIVNAHRAGARQILPEHLLQGLLAEEEGHPVQLTQSAGVTLESLRGSFPAYEEWAGEEVDLPLAPQTADILAQARELARLHGAEGTLSTEHLLLALLEGAPASRAALEKIGLNFAALKDRITPPQAPLRLEEPLDFSPPTEAIDVARILDASANRAREAVRVLEDFARFVLADAFLSAQLKNLRHGLAEALAELPGAILLQARDTLHDVGTAITTPRETQRASPVEVTKANAKRLQEALRSLEEFGKVLSPNFAMAIEQLRYHAYTLERALLNMADSRARLRDAKLYALVTEALCKTSLVGTVREALAGGVQMIQLREKTLTDRALLDRARDLRKMTRSAGALLIINDRPDIALLAEADGVHLGQDDLPLQEARRLLGAEAIIGISTHNLEQVRSAVLEGANYIGVGPTFPSQTKDFEKLAGLEFVKQVAAETSLPAFVLGGVTLDNIDQVVAAGGRRVAVSQALCAAADPRDVALRMRAILEK